MIAVACATTGAACGISPSGACVIESSSGTACYGDLALEECSDSNDTHYPGSTCADVGLADSSEPAGSDTAGGDSFSCLALRGDCTDGESPCCHGLACVATSTTAAECMTSCSGPAECPETCCLALVAGGGVCAEQAADCEVADPPDPSCGPDYCWSWGSNYECDAGACVCKSDCQLGNGTCCGELQCAGGCAGHACCP